MEPQTEDGTSYVDPPDPEAPDDNVRVPGQVVVVVDRGGALAGDVVDSTSWL